nr:MAG TPA: hypothetical protein [Caudoviricetes sp.]
MLSFFIFLQFYLVFIYLFTNFTVQKYNKLFKRVWFGGHI